MDANETTTHVIRAFTALAVSIQKATVLVATTLWTMAARAYLEHHDRLPGSTRTSRLRKKRKVIVLRWFEKYIEDVCRHPDHGA